MPGAQTAPEIAIPTLLCHSHLRENLPWVLITSTPSGARWSICGGEVWTREMHRNYEAVFLPILEAPGAGKARLPGGLQVLIPTRILVRFRVKLNSGYDKSQYSGGQDPPLALH
jgi:hypothetical protein